MIDRIESSFEAAQQAFRLIVDRAVSVNPWWVLAGIVLYELAQVLRTRGWFNILRAAYPDATRLRWRDVAGAYLAGAGLNGVLPARGGDALKLFMVHRKVPGSRYPTLLATLVPETLFESLCGAALVVWAVAHGFLPVPVAPSELPGLDVSFIIVHPVLSAVATAAIALGGVLLVRGLGPRASRLAARLRQGFAILGRPRDFVLGVASWQALGRLIRLGSLACFMASFGLPLTASTAVLVMAAQGAGRIIPLAPVSAGLRIAMLSYGFVEVTNSAVDVAGITSFWFLVGATHLIAGLVIATVVLGVTLGSLSPRPALAAARQAAGEAAVEHLPTPAALSQEEALARRPAT